MSVWHQTLLQHNLHAHDTDLDYIDISKVMHQHGCWHKLTQRTVKLTSVICAHAAAVDTLYFLWVHHYCISRHAQAPDPVSHKSAVDFEEEHVPAENVIYCGQR